MSYKTYYGKIVNVETGAEHQKLYIKKLGFSLFPKTYKCIKEIPLSGPVLRGDIVKFMVDKTSFGVEPVCAIKRIGPDIDGIDKMQKVVKAK